MNIIDQLQEAFTNFIHTTFKTDVKVILELQTDERKQQFGDISSNAALILAKELGKPPREIAQHIAQHFTDKSIETIEIAGPGFLNIFLTSQALQKLAKELFVERTLFFKPDKLEKPYKYSLEFISVNPTGPLHFGHGRGGIIGDVLGNVLAFSGHHVTKEFYINDAGRQIQQLGISLKTRCEQLTGIDSRIPEEGYHGEYLKDIAKPLVDQHGSGIFDQPDSFFTEYAKTTLLQQIQKTLNQYGIYYNVWFSELTLHKKDIKQTLDYLQKHNLLYEKDGALWFKSSEFGDDKDRVVKRANGEYTYVAADIAYLKNKVERDHDYLIMILGHDHHGYTDRLQAALKALDLKAKLHIILYQLVKIKASGQLVRMSKRAGNLVTLQDVIDLVGTDVARFFYLNRKADVQLEFDMDLALKKTEENPVYYIQYAYVRTGSILNKAKEIAEFANITQKDAEYITAEESLLLKKIASLKSLLSDIGVNYQTHLLAYYTHELAQIFSRYYANHKVIDVAQIDRSRGRLLMVVLLRETLGLCLDLMGISKPERM